MPPRPPPIVLWIVVVTTSAYGTGLGCRSAATRPAKCAISTISSAPTSSAISRKRARPSWHGEAGEVELARVGRPAGQQQLRLALTVDPRNLVHVDEARVAVDLVRRDVV